MATYPGDLIKIDQGFHGFALEIEVFKLAALRTMIGFEPII